jgi:hypothetical protein
LLSKLLLGFLFFILLLAGLLSVTLLPFGCWLRSREVLSALSRILLVALGVLEVGARVVLVVVVSYILALVVEGLVVLLRLVKVV